MTNLHPAARQRGTSSCGFDGCCGCYLCNQITYATNSPDLTKNATPHPKNNTETPRSWADVVRNRHVRSPYRPAITPMIDLTTAFNAEEDEPIGSLPNSNLSMSSDHVETDDDHTTDNPSPNPTSASNEEIQKTAVNQEAPKNKNKKNRWTRDQMKDVIRCFYEGQAKNLTKVKGTYSIWRQKNKDCHPQIGAVGLNTQRNFFMKKQMSKDELYQIELEVKRKFNEEAGNEPSPPSISQTNPPPIQNTNEETRPNNIDNDTKDEYLKIVDKYKEEITVKFEASKNIPLADRARPKKLDYSPESKQKLKAANQAITELLEDLHELDCTTLNTLYYAAASVVAGNKKVANVHTDKPPKKEKLLDEIDRARAKVGKLTDLCKYPTARKQLKLRKLLKDEEPETALQKQRMLLSSLCKKLRTKNDRRERFKNNKMFRQKQKAFYAKLRGQETNTISDPPTKESMNSFWKGILEDNAKHNQEAGWLKAEKEAMADVEEAKWMDISEGEMNERIKGLKNWKAPGLDGVQNYWIKYFTSLKPMLNKIINQIINEPDLSPKWLTQGKTTLIFKKGEENKAKNYRPITCLPTMYKLATLLITDRVYRHTDVNNILPFEQKGCRREARGCKEHLMLDRNILEYARKNKRNLSLLWIDYKKAYDSVPHSWILEVLEIYKIDPVTRRFVLTTMKNWTMQISLSTELGNVDLDTIHIKRGIFQGDSFSPLMFCLALAPLSRMLHRAKTGFKIKKALISHLKYMDDLKIYAKNREEMKRCIELVEVFSKDIKMDFGVDKCAVIHIKNGTPSNVPFLSDIPTLQPYNLYKFLGIN